MRIPVKLALLALVGMAAVMNPAAEEAPPASGQTSDPYQSAPRSILRQSEKPSGSPVPPARDQGAGAVAPLRPLRPSEQISLDTPVDFPSDI